jgi:carbonic anhydrase
MSSNNTWEDTYINLLKNNKDNNLNFKHNSGSFCKEKCRFQFNGNTEKYLKVELSKRGEKGINSVMNINLSQDGEHQIIYNGGIENNSKFIKYTLKNIFIKLVSIHAINSEKYKMELIMKYVSSGDSIVYVCTLLDPVDTSNLSNKDSNENAIDLFTEISNNFPKQMGKEYKIKGINNWSINDLLPIKDDNNFRGFYTYNTSKNVSWIVFKTPLKIPNEFYYKFIKKIKISESKITNEMDKIPPTNEKIVFVSDYDETNIINNFDGDLSVKKINKENYYSDNEDDSDEEDETYKNKKSKDKKSKDKKSKDKNSNDTIDPKLIILGILILLLMILGYIDLRIKNTISNSLIKLLPFIVGLLLILFIINKLFTISIKKYGKIIGFTINILILCGFIIYIFNTNNDSRINNIINKLTNLIN